LLSSLPRGREHASGDLRLNTAVPTLLAAAAGALGAPSLARVAALGSASVRAGTRRVARRLPGIAETLLGPVRRLAAEGIIPSDRERLRLQAAAGSAGFILALSLAGFFTAVVVAALSGWLASRWLVRRRDRYARRLDAGAAAAALALADALGGGHSLRGAIKAAAHGLGGPIGVELRRVAGELEVGGQTDTTLERFRRRARSRRIDLIVAGVSVQRRAGGNLVELLRRIVTAIEDQDRVEEEARAASAQARFTSLVVLLLPACGLLLGELASPGMARRMLDSPAGAWLCGIALLLQGGGMLLIRRLGRVEP
jgi:tight adherence protein B